MLSVQDQSELLRKDHRFWLHVRLLNGFRSHVWQVLPWVSTFSPTCASSSQTHALRTFDPRDSTCVRCVPPAGSAAHNSVLGCIFATTRGVYDEWCMMSGVWRVVYDEWCMLSGVWWVVYSPAVECPVLHKCNQILSVWTVPNLHAARDDSAARDGYYSESWLSSER